MPLPLSLALAVVFVAAPGPALTLACSGSGGDTGGDAGGGTDSGSEAADPAAWDATARGPYNVGFTSFAHTYAPLAGESRDIVINVWYPTTATEGGTATYAGQFYGAADILADAEPAEPVHGDAYPLHLFSHGDQAYGGNAEFLMAWVASHGWVAAAPDHTDNLLFDNVEPTPQGHWYHRPLDIQATADALADAELLAGPVDTTRYLLSGHSRGTSTVWTLAGASFDPSQLDDYCPDCSAEQQALFTDGSLVDARAVAAVPLAGGIRGSLFGEDPVVASAPVTVPLLYMTGTEDSGDPQGLVDALTAASDPPDLIWVSLEGGCHQTFALGTCETLDSDDGFRMVGSYVLAFGRVHLLGDEGEQVRGIVDGSVVVDERASWTGVD